METDFCLILSDLNMPIMDGYEFGKLCKQLFQTMKIPEERQPKLVAVTGNVEVRYIKQAYECSYDQVLSKPISCDSIQLLLMEQGLGFTA